MALLDMVSFSAFMVSIISMISVFVNVLKPRIYFSDHTSFQIRLL